MKIIDAHFHMFPESAFSAQALQAVGHQPGFAHLQDYYQTHDFVHGVLMTNGSTSPDSHHYPPQFHYCIGLDRVDDAPERVLQALDQIEANLQSPQCCGVKLYPGYSSISLSDPCYQPVYALAEQYGKPVAIHTGQTAFPRASLKTAHPLELDAVAVAHPRVQFVMCHFGNPFLPDAAAVVEKNQNVAADLSGLLEGYTPLDTYFQEQAGYVQMLKGWIAYVNRWDSFLFGTDFPAVNLENYAAFCQRLIPESHWEAFFFQNANRIYQLGL